MIFLVPFSSGVYISQLLDPNFSKQKDTHITKKWLNIFVYFSEAKMRF
jgi:hypothetical protein